MKNCNTMLTEEQQKYQHYLLERLKNMNMLTKANHIFFVSNKRNVKKCITI